MTQTSSRYTKTAVILHWLIAIFIFLMFGLGWYMADLPKEAPKQMAYDLFDLGIYTWNLATAISPAVILATTDPLKQNVPPPPNIGAGLR